MITVQYKPLVKQMLTALKPIIKSIMNSISNNHHRTFLHFMCHILNRRSKEKRRIFTATKLPTIVQEFKLVFPKLFTENNSEQYLGHSFYPWIFYNFLDHFISDFLSVSDFITDF